MGVGVKPDVVGVDFSTVAIEKAREAAQVVSSARRQRFVVADLLTLPNAEVQGPFDVLFDGGTIDDFPPRLRPDVARVVTELSRPGSVLVMWCFYARMADLPLMSFSGPSRWGAPPIEPGEEKSLFAAHWEIERFDEATGRQPASACFVMTRR